MLTWPSWWESIWVSGDLRHHDAHVTLWYWCVPPNHKFYGDYLDQWIDNQPLEKSTTGPRLNIMTAFPMYGNSNFKDKTVVGPSCLVHSGVRDKRLLPEIDLSQPWHETAFWWCHNWPVTSQLTDPIMWPNHPSELIGIYGQINTHNKECLTQRSRRSTNAHLSLIVLYIYMVWVLMDGMPYVAPQITVTTSP